MEEGLKYSREEFIGITGVFVTPSYFEFIKLEYWDFINSPKYAKFIEMSGILPNTLTKDEVFPIYWLVLNMALGTIKSADDGTFKYSLLDEYFN